MKKLAVFAEGSTEASFVERLLLGVAEEKSIQVQLERRGGGAGGAPRSRFITEIRGAKADHKYFAQIVNCTNDERVSSDLRDEYELLIKQGFDAIIAIKDARGVHRGTPTTLADVPKLRRAINFRIPTAPIKPTMVLSVMEAEAWFIAEHTHFSRINPALSAADIASVMNFDVSASPELVETIEKPAESLHAIYQRAGEQYVKPGSIKRTVNSLDIVLMYLEIGRKIPAAIPLMAAIDDFLSS